MKVRSQKPEVRSQKARAILWLGFLTGLMLDSLAQEKLPALRPPLGEIPPTFWELHETAVLVAVPVAMLLLALGIWLLLRPRTVVPVSPEVQARTALEDLLKQPEDDAVVSRASQVLRRYVLAAFQIPGGEPTTTEFCQLIAGHERVGPELSAALTNFLRKCDERKFAPNSLPAPGMVTQALRLLEQVESRRVVKSNERVQVA